MRKVLCLIWVTLGISFTVWMWSAFQAKGVDNNVFANSQSVRVVVTTDAISFFPTVPIEKVLIFYPGAMVDPDAYAPLCRKITDEGYKVLLIKMLWRLATRGYRKPIEMDVFADTSKQYILAGHSQGAKMACQFVS